MPVCLSAGKMCKRTVWHLQTPASCPPPRPPAGSLGGHATPPRAPSPSPSMLSSSGSFLSNPQPPTRPWSRTRFGAHGSTPCLARAGHHSDLRVPGQSPSPRYRPLCTPELTHHPVPHHRRPTSRPCNGNGAGRSARPCGAWQGGVNWKNSTLVENTKPGEVAWGAR